MITSNISDAENSFLTRMIRFIEPITKIQPCNTSTNDRMIDRVTRKCRTIELRTRVPLGTTDDAFATNALCSALVACKYRMVTKRIQCLCISCVDPYGGCIRMSGSVPIHRLISVIPDVFLMIYNIRKRIKYVYETCNHCVRWYKFEQHVNSLWNSPLGLFEVNKSCKNNPEPSTISAICNTKHSRGSELIYFFRARTPSAIDRSESFADYSFDRGLSAHTAALPRTIPVRSG